MPDITRKRTGEFLQKLFAILDRHPEGFQGRDALIELEKQVQLTPYEQGSYSNGDRRFEKIVRFATVDCVKAGWLIKQKGKWLLTDSGRQAVAQYKDPEAFYRQAVKLYREWKAAQLGDAPEANEADEPDVLANESASITFEQAEEQAWAEIQRYLGSMPPYEFQDLVAALLKAIGYYVQWVAPPGKDGGTDIIAWADALGIQPPRVRVQVKRQQQPVNVKELRSFIGVLGSDDVGLFVSTAGFTKDAQEEAREQDKRTLTLIDAERLYDLWLANYAKLDETARRHLPLEPIYFLAPSR